MPEQERERRPAGAWMLPGQGNAFAADTSEGVVLVDTGPGGRATDQMIAALRTRTDAPVSVMCSSHGHVGYNFGVPQWLDLCRARSKQMKPYPSKGLYKSSARLLQDGTTSWEGVTR